MSHPATELCSYLPVLCEAGGALGDYRVCRVRAMGYVSGATYYEGVEQSRKVSVTRSSTSCSCVAGREMRT